MRSTSFALLALGAGILGAGAAQAGMTFDPVYLHLRAEQPSTLLHVGNQSDKSMRYQLEVFAWSQGPAGEIELQPTHDVLVYPPLFELKPGEQRSVRVGAVAAPGASEKTYRVFITELGPAGEAAQPGVAVHVRPRVGLPIFLEPERLQSSAQIAAIAPSKDGLAVTLRSTGNAHLHVLSAHAVAEGAGGEPLLDRTWGATYLLAGKELRLAAAVPQARCRRVRSVKVDVITESGVLHGVRELGGACRP